ncbi:hypothetical protein Fot_18243 [Forsythia ovata]|uniref:Uncharacterized protein n=1 Tax=Forsythia ovata TaxID=205694 RepID=A0ABD1VHN6_9LAMI
MTGRQTRSGTRMTATTAESESVARDDQLPPLSYVTQIQFNSLETKIETLMAFLHNQTQKAAELAPKSSENHNGPPQLVEHQNAPPGIQPTGMGQGFSPPDAIPQMGPAVTPPTTCFENLKCNYVTSRTSLNFDIITNMTVSQRVTVDHLRGGSRPTALRWQSTASVDCFQVSGRLTACGRAAGHPKWAVDT